VVSVEQLLQGGIWSEFTLRFGRGSRYKFKAGSGCSDGDKSPAESFLEELATGRIILGWRAFF
jgi:hypothetical protein